MSNDRYHTAEDEARTDAIVFAHGQGQEQVMEEVAGWLGLAPNADMSAIEVRIRQLLAVARMAPRWKALARVLRVAELLAFEDLAEAGRAVRTVKGIARAQLEEAQDREDAQVGLAAELNLQVAELQGRLAAVEDLIGRSAEVEAWIGEAKELKAAHALLRSIGAGGLADKLRGLVPPRLKPEELPSNSPGAVVVHAAAALRIILDAAGRAIQEAKHHHNGRGQPLEGGGTAGGGLPAALVRALRQLEEVTSNAGAPKEDDRG